MEYSEFKEKVLKVLKDSGGSLSWDEIKERAGLKQKVPPNQWVRKLEEESGLVRKKVVLWVLK